MSGVLIKMLAVWVVLTAPFQAGALSFSNRYRSPRNAERQIRKSTKLIVLHTTEAGAKSSLNKLSERGEAHYCIDEKGTAYRIVDRNREAFHAGRSMWNGKEECDSYSIGIEVVGHHDQPVTLAQLDAIRDLLILLKKEYKLNDAQVVCHSHVAYGAPNKWQKRNHRGRKRCGMLFAMPSIRKHLKLKMKPAIDPDVRAKRLVVGDQYLERVLYGNIDTMAGKIGRNIAPEQKVGFFAALFNRKPAEAPKQTNATPQKVNQRIIITPPKVQQPPAQPAAQPELVKPAPPKTPQQKEPASLRDLQDRMKFKEIGTLGPKESPYKIAGRSWNAATTYYLIGDRVIRGDSLNPQKTPSGTRVFQRK